MLAVGREWKLEHVAELRAMFTTLLKPQNARLHHRIVEAVFAVLAPALEAIIERGRREGAFDVGDARVAAETLLWLSNGRRPIILQALTAAEADAPAALAQMLRRFRAEEALIERILGVAPGSVQLVGEAGELEAIIRAWIREDRARSL